MTTHFSGEQLGMLYKQFEKLSGQLADGDGAERTISYEKFKKIMRKVLPHLFPTEEKGAERDGDGKQSDDLCRNMFGLFDLNGSGKLTFKELMTGLSLFYQGTVQEKILLAFRLYDVGNVLCLSLSLSLFLFYSFSLSHFVITDKDGFLELVEMLDMLRDSYAAIYGKRPSKDEIKK